MSAEDILSRLEKVKRTGANNWLACCPAHEDRSPSLTLREEPDGRILVCCHAECSFEEIVGAVGLGWEPWFPPKPLQADYLPPVRRPYPAGDVLEALREETLLVLTSAAKLRSGEGLDEMEFARLLIAAERIERGRSFANG